MNHTENRKLLRKEKIHARDSLAPEQREELSSRIVKSILDSEEFKDAKTILIYRATRGEVRLNELEAPALAAGKRLAFPLCVSDSEMIALIPEGENSWKKGYFGIEEPVREKSSLVLPEEFDLILCPCSVFDEKCNRMGMGAGFYDRYLTKCREDACIAAVAFEVQKAAKIPMDPWDQPMDMVFTEEKTYRSEKI